MDSKFNIWYNTGLKQCEEAYNSIYTYCRNYIYNKLSNKHRTKELDELIDNAFKYRLGLTDIKPVANDRTVNEVLESLIYGNSLPKALISKFYEAFKKYIKEPTIRHEFKKTLRNAAESQYDRL